MLAPPRYSSAFLFVCPSGEPALPAPRFTLKAGWRRPQPFEVCDFPVQAAWRPHLERCSQALVAPISPHGGVKTPLPRKQRERRPPTPGSAPSQGKVAGFDLCESVLIRGVTAVVLISGLSPWPPRAPTSSRRAWGRHPRFTTTPHYRLVASRNSARNPACWKCSSEVRASRIPRAPIRTKDTQSVRPHSLSGRSE
jgi:hypothetical protein